MEDPIIGKYDAAELKIAAEFLTNWLPFLTKDLCENCATSLRDRVRSLDPDGKEDHSSAWAVSAKRGDGVRKSWADMAQEEELERGSAEDDKNAVEEFTPKGKRTELSREQREHIRFSSVTRKKDFICLERVGQKITNILDSLELHTGVFSAAEQKRIVNFVHELYTNGGSGDQPEKKTRDKDPITIQFGCCTSSTLDNDGNFREVITRDIATESMPALFNVIIKRLIRWHVLPPSCIPDSCDVHIFEPGDYISPRIVSRDFLRPFCAVSFVNDCDILFGSATISLPVGSAFVFNGNGANLTQHCIIGVPRKRILIIFRRMDEARRPLGFQPEPDLQGIQPLAQEDHVAKKKPSRRRRSSRFVVDGRSTGDSSSPLDPAGISPPPAGRIVIVDQQRIIVNRNLEETSSYSPFDSRSRSSPNRPPRENRPRQPRR